MASLKDIRKRISSVRSTQQITKAMKMVAAAKLRRAQEAAESSRPYAVKLGELLGNLASRVGEDAHPFLRPGSEAPAHVILVTSDRGLCGAYNASLIKQTSAFLESAEGREATMAACGRRGRDWFSKRLGARVLSEQVNIPGGYTIDTAREVAREAAARFTSGESGRVYLVYSQFRSALSQTPVVEQLLPVAQPTVSDDNEAPVDYLYEPDPQSLLETLLSRYIETRVFQAMLEGTASEHGARMTAMDNASRNASEMIERLTLQMNRARQAAITTELMEIIGGAEALNG
jgi:F-type H+-transporting ATPase subunit gamma